MPAQLTTANMFSIGDYETQVETMKRALAWVNATGELIDFLSQRLIILATVKLLTVQHSPIYQYMRPLSWFYNMSITKESVNGWYVLLKYIGI